ncbi:MAG: hypothetical protein V1837_00500 [Candidatus Woesearchaeota archaeon]
MAKKAKKLETKIKKKKWFSLVAPRLFSEQLLGETFIEDPKTLMNRYVTVNLMGLTGDPKKQSVNVTFKVVNVKDNKGYAECIAYEMSPSSIKRMVRRNRERLDDSFLAKTTDGKTVRIKPIVLTRFNTSNSVTATLRKGIRQLIIKAVAASSFEDLLHDIITNKFQSKLKDTLRPVYPLSSCDIRLLKIVSQQPLTVKEEPAPVQEEQPVIQEDAKADN